MLLSWPVLLNLGNDIHNARCIKHSKYQDIGLLERINIPGHHGPVMLGQIASIELASGPAVIDRYDRQRNVNFEIELSGMPLGDVTQAVQKLSALQSLPPGVKVVEVGDAEVMNELFASFGLAMLIGVLCIYIVLVLLFKIDYHIAVGTSLALIIPMIPDTWTLAPRDDQRVRAAASVVGLMMNVNRARGDAESIVRPIVRTTVVVGLVAGSTLMLLFCVTPSR